MSISFPVRKQHFLGIHPQPGVERGPNSTLQASHTFAVQMQLRKHLRVSHSITNAVYDGSEDVQYLRDCRLPVSYLPPTLFLVWLNNGSLSGSSRTGLFFFFFFFDSPLTERGARYRV